MSDYTDKVDDLDELYHAHHPQGRYPRHGPECLAPDYNGVCLVFRLVERLKAAEEQLALLPQRGRDVLRGFHEGANDLGPRPSPQTAPRPPHPADWGVAPEPDFGRAIGTGQTPRIGSFDDDVVYAEIIED